MIERKNFDQAVFQTLRYSGRSDNWKYKLAKAYLEYRKRKTAKSYDAVYNLVYSSPQSPPARSHKKNLEAV